MGIWGHYGRKDEQMRGSTLALYEEDLLLTFGARLASPPRLVFSPNVLHLRKFSLFPPVFTLLKSQHVPFFPQYLLEVKLQPSDHLNLVLEFWVIDRILKSRIFLPASKGR
jgi:hypothetical protein